MRFPSRRTADPTLPGVTGRVRADRRTASLLDRLAPGDIAVLDHLDLDRATATALRERGVAAVVNASPSISGRYPALGPQVLVEEGIPLVDSVGPEVFQRVRDGAILRVHDGTLYDGEQAIAAGRDLSADNVREQMLAARSGLTTQLETLTHSTTELLRREEDLLLHGQGAPQTRTAFRGRTAVVVVHAHGHEQDLRRLGHFIREQRPVLVGVDAGADALLAAGHRPDVVVVGEAGIGASPRSGQAQAVSDEALRTARDVVVHVDHAGHVPGAQRLDRLGVAPQPFPATAATEDVALLLADLSGASLVVTAGTPTTLDEFLDSRRAGLASAFLTRLRVGPKLVDARGIAALYSGRVRVWHLVAVVLAGFVALLVALLTTPAGQDWWDAAVASVNDLFDSPRGPST